MECNGASKVLFSVKVESVERKCFKRCILICLILSI